MPLARREPSDHEAMSAEFKVVISSPDDSSGIKDALSAADAPDRLAQAAVRTPDASLESLAVSARQAQAATEAARQPMAGLVNVPDAGLANLETGFGFDSQAKPIGGVERIGQVFTEAWQRPPESGAGNPPTAAVGGVPPAEDGSAGSAGPAARRKDVDGEIIGQPPAASRVDLGDLTTDSLPHQGTLARTAADSLARLPGTADQPAGGAGGFSATPTARASLGPALAKLAASPPAATMAPGAPTGGSAGKTDPFAGKFEAEGHGSEEATHSVDGPPAAFNQGFQTLDERLARVEQTTREHASQISNRS